MSLALALIGIFDGPGTPLLAPAGTGTLHSAPLSPGAVAAQPGAPQGSGVVSGYNVPPSVPLATHQHPAAPVGAGSLQGNQPPAPPTGSAETV